LRSFATGVNIFYNILRLYDTAGLPPYDYISAGLFAGYAHLNAKYSPVKALPNIGIFCAM